jgi:hypothetical protein
MSEEKNLPQTDDDQEISAEDLSGVAGGAGGGKGREATKQMAERAAEIRKGKAQ